MGIDLFGAHVPFYYVINRRNDMWDDWVDWTTLD